MWESCSDRRSTRRLVPSVAFCELGISSCRWTKPWAWPRSISADGPPQSWIRKSAQDSLVICNPNWWTISSRVSRAALEPMFTRVCFMDDRATTRSRRYSRHLPALCVRPAGVIRRWCACYLAPRECCSDCHCRLWSGESCVGEEGDRLARTAVHDHLESC